MEVKIVSKRLLLEVDRVDFYIFGSALINSKLANDIDILIVYENSYDLSVLKKELKIVASKNPIHFSCFTFSEEEELGFIQEQRAVKIFAL